MRPPTSKMCSGGTGRFGFTQANRLARRGTSWRPISSTYLKPAVVMSAAGAPLPSRIRLVAIVVPCSTRRDVGAGEARGLQHLGDAVAEAARGIVRRRRGLGAPDAARGRVQQRDVGERAARVDADDDAGLGDCGMAISRAPRGSRDGGRAWPPAAARGARPWPPRSTVSPSPRQHHAVVLLRARPADEAAAHVGQHALGLAVEGMAPAAATAGLDAHDVAAPHDVAVAQRAQDALVRPARD